ncbi:MAG: sulfatase [Armatimonadota bacterium]|nr:sulfatase [Armatimonadota bacterium]
MRTVGANTECNHAAALLGRQVQMDRREFLRRAGAGVMAGTLLDQALHVGSAIAGPRSDDRPNILFCIADDPSWAHFGAYGDPVVQTPNFDRVARDGVLFQRAYCSAPTCTASRGAILTGQAFYRLAEGANLWSTLPARFPVYPDLLEAAGYFVGSRGKGWGPGDFRPGGRARQPAGPTFPSFEAFLNAVPSGKPFCFWFGSTDPHRPYEQGVGVRSGMPIDAVRVPPFLPDTPEVRSDILDYLWEIQRFDRDVGAMLQQLEERGLLHNTLVVVTGDNGMPFPRAKANLYEYGTRLPLAVSWPARVKGGRVVEDFISFTDFAPTFLQAAGLKPLRGTTGRSFLDLLLSHQSGQIDAQRNRVILGRERHANVRAGNVGYPCRALRNRQFLYIRNFEPDRWPAGDPERFGDIDGGPTKTFLLQNRDDPRAATFFQLACGKRPPEELYDLEKDPAELTNVADRPEYATVLRRLRGELERELKRTGDPRMGRDGGRFDTYPYYGRQAQPET